MFKKILVPLLDGAFDPVALKAALSMACRYNAHVAAFHLGEDPSSASDGAASRMARSRFVAAATAFGVPIEDGRDVPTAASASWHDASLSFPAEIGLAVRSADLVVFSADTIDPHSLLGSILQSTLLDSGHPVLLVPGRCTTPFGRRVAVAWNGDPEARHATDGGLPLLQRADAIVVLCDPVVSKDPASMRRLQDFLASHRLDAEIVTLGSRNRGTAQALVDRAKQLKADILVMGAHPVPHRASHGNALRGTVTRNVIDHVEIPILMAS
ncbi:MAG TPA: universal stress protein [Azospirillum sp.]|nr:universal stress protein [Azospirillum sp.]